MLPSRLTTSRRRVMAAVLGAPLALVACTSDPPPSPPGGEPATAPVPDAEVVASARDAILLVVATLEGVGAEHPQLVRELRPWLDLHAAHLEVLDSGAGAADALEAATPPARPEPARQQVLADERRLARDLAQAARQAGSGDLARALASMSAAVDQRVVA